MMKKIIYSSVIVSTIGFGAAYKVPEQSINSMALGAAYVAHTSGADSAYYNPAAMSFMDDKNYLEGSLTLAHLPSIKYDLVSPYSGKTKVENIVIPNLHYVSKAYGDIKWGISITTPAGLSKRWDTPYQKLYAQEFTLRNVEINPSVSYRVSDSFSIANGLRVIYSEGKVYSDGSDARYPIKRQMEGDTIEFGYNLALLYKAPQDINLAVTYRSNVDLDEEGDAKYGTQIVLEYLKDKDMLPDCCIVAEPTCKERFGDAIKVGRRGSINGILKLKGKQGHAAYPQKAINPIHQISKVLPKIAGVDLDSGDEYFAPSKFVITDIRSGMEVTNVTPGELKMMFNVRNSTKTTQDDIKAFVDDTFSGLDYELELVQSAYPFVTNSDTKIVQTIDKAIQEVCDITPKHSTAGGTSDARFIARYGIDVIEFGVINDTIHAPNERTTIKEVEDLYRVFSKTIELYSKDID